jgi:hypothetical protein
MHLKSLLQYSITSENIRSFVLINIECNNYIFLVGKVVKISPPNCLVQILVGKKDPFTIFWNIIPKLVKLISTELIFQKKCNLSKN